MSPRFPAVLDTGHSHNFSIREEELKAWTGLVPEAMEVVGSIRVNNRLVLLREGELVLHRNVPGSRDEIQGEPHWLEMTQGIVIHKSGDPLARCPYPSSACVPWCETSCGSSLMVRR